MVKGVGLLLIRSVTAQQASNVYAYRQVYHRGEEWQHAHELHNLHRRPSAILPIPIDKATQMLRLMCKLQPQI